MDLVVSNQTSHQNLREDSKQNEITVRELEWYTFLACIGAHEFFSPEMWRAALTELVAAATLMFTLTTSIISCLDSHEPDPKLVVPFAVFINLFLFLMVTVPLSGGHMSPIFTFIATLKGLITFSRASIYVLAQCIGSVIGFLVINSVMSHQAADKYSLGGCAIGSDGSSPEFALILEFSSTFVVLFVGVTVAFDKRRCEALGLTMVCVIVSGSVALVVFVSITVTGRVGYAGVGLNPARCLGPALLKGGALWNGHWVFWVGPFFGCIVYYGFSLNLPKENLVMGDGEYDFIRLALVCWRGKGTPASLQEKKGNN